MTLRKTACILGMLGFLLAACAAPAAPQAGRILGGVFCDSNADRDCACEEGFADIRIHLHQGDCSGPILQSVLSGEDGSFAFNDLAPGPYCVFADIAPLCGGEAGYNLTTGISRPVEVQAGWTHELLWFGLTPLMHSTPQP